MLSIIYEDDDILAVDKPIGISSIPERDQARDSVLLLLQKQTGRKCFVVHRLDKEVSGCLLFAKNARAHRFLNEAFLSRNVHKTYVALLSGSIADSAGSIEKPLRQFGSGRMGVDEERGKPSTTTWASVRRMHDVTLVNAWPVTGRRHQIRVHFYSIGHPVAGDRIYGDRTRQKQYPRLMLHARELSLAMSESRTVTVAAPVPPEFAPYV